MSSSHEARSDARSHERADRGGEHGGRTQVGLIADPDFPQLVAEDLAEDLPSRLRERGWKLEVEVNPVAAGQHNSNDILEATRERKRRRGWDYAITLTDLPVWAGEQPVLSDVNRDENVAVVSMPALGATQPYRRTRQMLAQLVEEFIAPSEQVSDDEDQQHGLRSPLTEVLAPVRRESREEQGEVDIRYLATRNRGRVRLLTGMVRTNRPWRLIFGLSSALAAALASSAFGLSSSTIWLIGDRMGVVRQLFAGLAAVALLVVWLIVAHHLWEKSSAGNGRDREQRMLYNLSTVVSLTIGVGCMYLGLFAVNLAVASYLVRPSLVESVLGHPVDATTYLTLAWSFTTMGVVAGALGSSLETDEAVRHAAYGYREEQRRAQQQRQEEQQRRSNT